MKIESDMEWVTNGRRATPVLYLDLDDTVRKGFGTTGKWVNGPEDVEVFPEVPGILQVYKDCGWRIVGVSNQGGIALGHVTMAQVVAAMSETFHQCKRLFDRILFCSHHPEAADPEFAICWCRKPRIGLIIEGSRALFERHREYYPPHLALFVGDLEEDRVCAENAGIRFLDAALWRAGGWKETAHPVGYVTETAAGVQ